MTTSRPTARVYIDGFNLYYGALKDSSDKWLDVVAWAQALLPQYDIEKVVYCTARVQATSASDRSPSRQDFYLQALSSHGERVEVLEGKFRLREVTGARRSSMACTCCGPQTTACLQCGTPQCYCCSRRTATITKPEEKGSDVNLAVRLVRDAFVYATDAFLVISNDSDLQEAVTIVEEMGRTVIVVNPQMGKYQVLVAKERRKVRRAGLTRAQFPDVVTLLDGSTVTRPKSW